MNHKIRFLPGLAALLLSLSLASAALAAAPAPDWATECNALLEQTAQAQTHSDNAVLLRLQAMAREAGSAGELRLLENQLLKWLEPATSLRAKEYACRILWQIGTAQSAPALQRLLTQPDTVDLACYAIAGNPAPELGEVLRNALPTSTGPVAVSLLNLLGQRRDPQAVPLILPFLHREGPERPAALAALGKIGTSPAVQALAACRSSVSPDQRSAVDEAFLQALETVEPDEAVPVWNRMAADPQEALTVRRQALLRLSERAAAKALPYLMAGLRDEQSPWQPILGACLRHVQSGPYVRQLTALAAGLPPSSQIILIMALGTSLPAETLLSLSHSPQAPVRRAALSQLAAQGGVQAARALLAEAIQTRDRSDRTAIAEWLGTMPGPETTLMLVEALPSCPAELLPDLVRILTVRKTSAPLPVLLHRARSDPQAEARIDAIRALKLVATAEDYPALFDLLTTTKTPEVHEALELALSQIFRASGSAENQTAWLIGELGSPGRPQDRAAWLRLLAQMGTPHALKTVLGILDNPGTPDEERQSALDALMTWPNAAAIPPLLERAKQSDQTPLRTPLLRSLVQMLRHGDLRASEQVAPYRTLAALSRDAADRKLVLSGLAQVADPSALEMILAWLNQPGVRTEVAVAAISVARRLPLEHAALISQAMNQIAAAVADTDLQSQARDLIVPPPPDVFLDTLKPLEAKSGNTSGQPMINRNCVGAPLRLQGTTFPRGIGEHAPASLTYAIQPDYHRFVCLAGLDDQVGRFGDVRGSIILQVWANDQRLAETPLLRGAGAWCGLNLEIPPNTTSLRLVVNDAGDGVDFDDANLINAGFLLK